MVESIVDRLGDVVRSCGFPVSVYLVGGSVRDLILGRMPKDLDFVVFGPVKRFAVQAAKALGGMPIYLGQTGKEVWRVVRADLEVDITPPRGPNLERDLGNRDFTVNALAWSVTEKRIVDLAGGLDDLDRRVIRMTNREVFRQDPVRLLRAFRVGAALEFDVEPETLHRICLDRELMGASAPERIGAEMLALLDCPRSAGYVRKMARCGLLASVFPLSPLSFPEPSDPGEDRSAVMPDAPFRSLECLEEFIGKPESFFPGDAAPLREWLNGPGHTALLKLALLIMAHADAAPTPEGASSGKDGISGGRENLRSPSDGLNVSDIVARLTRRLALSNKNARLTAVLLHGCPLAVQVLPAETDDSGFPEEQDILLFLHRAGEHSPGLLLLALALLCGEETAQPAAPTRPARSDSRVLEAANRILNVYVRTYIPRMAEPRLITGNDLAAMGVPKGPRYKSILEEVEAARIVGRITRREEAVSLVRRLVEH